MHAQTYSPSLSSLRPSIQQCAVKSLTPAVVVSWFKGSVITNGNELACECQQHSWGVRWGQRRHGPWRGKPDLPQCPTPPRTAYTAPPHQNHAAPLAVAIETFPQGVFILVGSVFYCFKKLTFNQLFF